MKLVAVILLAGSALWAQEDEHNKWVPPEPPEELHAQLCHKDYLRFWRIRMPGGRGNWHLYNQEDARFLADMARQIKNGDRLDTKIEWTAIEGRLPK